MRRASTWLVALPVIVVGSQVAHGIAYWWTYPQASLRLAVLQHSGHSYLAYAPTILGFLVALEFLVLIVTVLDRLQGHSARPLPAWLFLVLPVLGYTLQEHLERLLASGAFPWWTVLQPTFARGVALQVPLGFLAYVIARLLLRTAEAVAQIVCGRDGVVGRRSARGSHRRPQSVLLLRAAPLALAAAGRAPPGLLVIRKR